MGGASPQLRRSLFWIGLLWVLPLAIKANPDAKRLYDDLIMKGYNRFCRPVRRFADQTRVQILLSLAQIVRVDEVNQILTVNLWVDQAWQDTRFIWDKRQYNNISMLHVPAEKIWKPDIVLYNNADGDYTITTMGKAVIYPDGTVIWKPPMQAKSSCEIDVRYFPFDNQHCHMKFGSWSYDETKVDLIHMKRDGHLNASDRDKIKVDAMELDDYQRSVEWDLMAVSAEEHLVEYPCCPGITYPDVVFFITIRRKTLYFVINLIIPLLSMTLLTCLSFYLPSYSGEKISITISVFLALSIFQLLLWDLIPSTSINLPLIGKYILVTGLMVTMSVLVNTVILTVNYRASATHQMSNFTRWLFLKVLSRFLYMHNPMLENGGEKEDGVFSYESGYSDMANYGNPYAYQREREMLKPLDRSTDNLQEAPEVDQTPRWPRCDTGAYEADPVCEACEKKRMMKYPANIRKGLDGACFIGGHYNDEDVTRKAKDEWQYVALVLDRILLCIYIVISLLCVMTIMMNAPALYNNEHPLVTGSRTPLPAINRTRTIR